MTFQINGATGKYDGKIKDDSVRYGRNAVENHIKYMETPLVENEVNPTPIFDFSFTPEGDKKNFEALENFMDKNDDYLDSLPPLEFEYRYMPNLGIGKVDNKAVLGAAFEEMDTKEIPVKEFENRYLINNEFTAEPLDINKDGKIDIAEYGSNILATDVLSKGTTDISKIDGTINTRGLNAILEYTKKANAEAASKLYSQIYNTYKLGENLNEFRAE